MAGIVIDARRPVLEKTNGRRRRFALSRLDSFGVDEEDDTMELPPVFVLLGEASICGVELGHGSRSASSRGERWGAEGANARVDRGAGQPCGVPPLPHVRREGAGPRRRAGPAGARSSVATATRKMMFSQKPPGTFSAITNKSFSLFFLKPATFPYFIEALKQFRKI